MAQHVHDPAVFERRLRPIYDNLEVGNNRKALQETEKLLKKQPNLLCARALKGLALLRLGRYDESHTFLQSVADAQPYDDSTLQVLSFCYRELEQLDKIVELYSNAVKQSPRSEELLAHLFISYVRLEDFKSQKSVALQLYKAVPKNAYYFWAVMSVVLQGIRGPESKNPEKRKIFLTLAQRMVGKLLIEGKLEVEQEVHLLLYILDLQEKYEEELEFFDGSLRRMLYPGAPIYMKINLLKKLKKWQDLHDLLQTLLKEEPDRWDYYQDYLSACFELLQQEKPEVDAETPAATNSVLEDCKSFLYQLIETSSDKVRGPYLARLELHKRMRSMQLDAVNLLGDFNELVIHYFRLFGDKSCCTHDVALFVESITLEERLDLARQLLLESGISSTTLPQKKQQMQKHICALQISRICGSHIDLQAEHLLAFYTALKLHYEHGLGAFGLYLLNTDMGPSDPYALLAANIMYDVSLRQQKSDRLFEALCLLQYVLRNSPSNFHVKLLSLKIYHIFGCISGAQEMYDYLDIKQIQLDSMGYVHCSLLPLCGRTTLARNVYDTTLKFFTHSYKDRLEYIALTYRFCTFSKLEEFMNFKDRLSNSLHYVSTSVEAQLLDLTLLFGSVAQNLATYAAMSIEPANDRISWNELSDNRDLTAIVRWDPLHLLNADQERKDSLEQEIEALHIRSLTLRLIASFIDLFHTPSPNAKQAFKESSTSKMSPKDASDQKPQSSPNEPAKDTETVEMLKDAWDELFKQLRQKNYKPVDNRFLVNLLPSRLHLLLKLPYDKFFSDLARLILDLYTGVNSLPIQCKLMSDNVIGIVEICINTINESNAASEDGLWRRREWQNTVAACLEMLSLYAFVLSVAHERLQNPTKSKSRKKSTSEQLQQQQQQQSHHDHTVSEKERVQLLIELMRHLKHRLQMCEGVIKAWKSPVLPRDLNSFMADMSLQPEFEATLIGEVSSIFKESHQQMLTDLKNLIKDKLRMLSK